MKHIPNIWGAAMPPGLCEWAKEIEPLELVDTVD
ncbi:UNVERIFIED_CONTAM: hypothetical protein DES50_101246 [Williamsia faeni]